ncbi:hypothetical protein CQW23_32085 [Capsicum baccatum]|uniref:Receptor-like protein 12 n=1 Tax=Capsicum baccatum TaxID=33114 RepID=A0A2G2V5P8_CAPBA|nr:hypothetical protein CQW23_32085 [Capsicum baccatum]
MGAIPQCFGNMSGHLRVLDMQHNNLLGICSTTIFLVLFQRLLALEVHSKSFNLHGNKLEEKIARSLKNCQRLEVLDLGNNFLNDTFPMWLGTLPEFCENLVAVVTKGMELEVVRILFLYTTIDLSNNKFEGHIPSSIGDLIALGVLNLSHNGLQGHIPPSLGSLSSVESLDLSDVKDKKTPAQWS